MPIIEAVLWLLAAWVVVSFGLALAWIIFSSITRNAERRARHRQVDRLIAQYKREHEGRRR